MASDASTQVWPVAPATVPRVAARVPWYLWCGTLAVTSVAIGGHWDIAWHRSIGRDSFWTPAHVAIYLCGVLAAIACGYLILRQTLVRRSGEADPAVHILGFRGPLGAFVAAWGGITMLVSAPFDNWWHSAYGLDVKIISPPHVVLFLGVIAVEFGVLLLIASRLNRVSAAAETGALNRLFLYVGGLIVVTLQGLLLEYESRVILHHTMPYRLMALFLPLVLAAFSRVSRIPFAATITSSIYFFYLVGLIWILPLFPAEPKLGPVYQPVTHFIPPYFPILLFVPAFCVDLFWQRSGIRNRWLLSVGSGAIFCLALLACEWPFASFLNSSAAQNWIFGSHYLPYAASPTTYIARNAFYTDESFARFWFNMGWAVVFGTISVRAGLALGEWMRRVRR